MVGTQRESHPLHKPLACMVAFTVLSCLLQLHMSIHALVDLVQSMARTQYLRVVQPAGHG